MNKTALGIITTLILIGLGGGIYLATRQSSAPVDTGTTTKVVPAPGTTNGEEKPPTSTFKPGTFDNIKSPHYVSSDPVNNAVLNEPPEKVTINFNFNLANNSKVEVAITDGRNVALKNVEFSSDKLSMSLPIIYVKENANYKTNYTACWPDGSCHNGSFGFSVKLP